ncbi:TadE family type IV pilus minor pilin [Microcella sp.]|uniref:TadE family type IV pilus minor pilin n=1 Tax=Microcella sp. TaxID=1913979 RepID=UPI003919AB87
MISSRRPAGFRADADRGSVTAEIAVGLPAVVLVLAACLGGLGLATTQLRAHDAAADAARLLGRGEPAAAAQQHVARSIAGAALTVSRPAELVCVRVVVEQRLLLVPVRVVGSACALDGGR